MKLNQIFCRHIYKEIKIENLEGNRINVYKIDTSKSYRWVGITEECIKCLKKNYKKDKIFEFNE